MVRVSFVLLACACAVPAVAKERSIPRAPSVTRTFDPASMGGGRGAECGSAKAVRSNRSPSPVASRPAVR